MEWFEPGSTVGLQVQKLLRTCSHYPHDPLKLQPFWESSAYLVHKTPPSLPAITTDSAAVPSEMPQKPDSCPDDWHCIDCDVCSDSPVFPCGRPGFYCRVFSMSCKAVCFYGPVNCVTKIPISNARLHIMDQWCEVLWKDAADTNRASRLDVFRLFAKVMATFRSLRWGPEAFLLLGEADFMAEALHNLCESRNAAFKKGSRCKMNK